MASLRSICAPAVAVLLLWPATPARAQSAASEPRKSVYGTLESVDTHAKGVIMKSEAGERLAWRFKPAVIEELARFKPGDKMIVIYRQISQSDKRVTAVAFPGTAQTALYVNVTGERVLLRSAPAVDGVCGRAEAATVTDSMLPAGSTGEAPGACWCCASPGQSCTPSSKTGQGKALLVSCFE